MAEGNKSPLDHGIERFGAEVLELTTSKPRIAELDELETALERQRIAATIEHVGEADIGRLSAEAVLSQYEVAAKAVETMGEDMKVSIKGLEAAMIEADAAMKAVTELAATIREKGKLHQVRVEQATLMAKEIKDACAEFHRKIGA